MSRVSLPSDIHSAMRPRMRTKSRFGVERSSSFDRLRRAGKAVHEMLEGVVVTFQERHSHFPPLQRPEVGEACERRVHCRLGFFQPIELDQTMNETLAIVRNVRLARDVQPVELLGARILTASRVQLRQIIQHA
jgi:hypothetical protein